MGVFTLLCWPWTVLAGPGDGINLGSWVLSPYLDIVFTHDSNVYKDYTNEIDDIYFEPEVGLRFSSSGDTNCLSLRGNVYYSDRQYDQEKNRDFVTYGDSLNFRWGNGRRALLELIQSYRFLDDNDRHAADIESSTLASEMIEDSNALDLEREIHQVGVSLSRRFTDKLELALAYRYAGVIYANTNHNRLEPKQLYVPRGLDLDGHILEFTGGLGLTEKTDLVLTLRQGLQYQEGISDPAELTTARLGLKNQGTEKLVYGFSAGLEYYARPGQTRFAEADLGEDDVEVTAEGVEIHNDQISFNFAAAVDWYATEKLTFRGGGYNGTQFSSFYEQNGVEYMSLWLGAGYRWKPSTIFSVRGIGRYDDYLDPVTHQGVTQDRHDWRLEGHARVDYIAPGGFVRFYLEGTYDEVNSNFDFVEYVDVRLILGAKVMY